MYFFALLSQYREGTGAKLSPSHLFEEKLGLTPVISHIAQI